MNPDLLSSEALADANAYEHTQKDPRRGAERPDSGRGDVGCEEDGEVRAWSQWR